MNGHAAGLCPFAFASVFFAISQTQAAQPMTLDVRLGQPLMQADAAQKNYLRIALTGCQPQAMQRNPVNVAFVIDRSGSMQGSRMAQARVAAISALRRLNGEDFAAVVIFDDRVDVLVPSRKVDDHAAFTDPIEGVAARGSTAIHAGILEGAREVRKHRDNRRLNRVVLISDGHANVGPRLPAEFAQLGRDLLAEGISVSTIGLGLNYNEDLMAQLARASDGNHAFASAPADLIPIFNREFDDVLASCAQMVSIDVDLAPGLRAVRALSREGTITAQHAQFTLGQVYQATEHYVLLEVEADPQVAGDTRDFGRVSVTYTQPQDGSQHRLDAGISGRFTAIAAEAGASRDNRVMEAVVEQVARARTETAVQLRDAGKAEEARALLRQNATDIEAHFAAAGARSPRLDQLRQDYGAIANAPASTEHLNVQRKLLRQLALPPATSGVRY
ncbi:MAG: VWA domain-containing protein [Proteobacteria bacterium]|nr:VWA domain-containing protein [Pseudomonadota bacterium]